MSVAIKASLYKTCLGDPVEIRRFSVDEVTAKSYAILLEQMAKRFPSVTALEGLTLAWIDDDGDTVTISSDEELTEALEHFKGNLFRLCIKTRVSGSAATSSKPPSDCQDVPTQSSNFYNSEQGGYFHPGVICDGCNRPIYGTRFKCMNCSDYDLCSGCEGKGIHMNHNMIGITQYVNLNPCIHAFSSGSHRRCGSFFGGGGCKNDKRRCHCKPFFHRGWEGKLDGRGTKGPGACSFFPGQSRQCRQERKPNSEASEAEPEHMDTEQKGDLSVEDHRGLLREVGEVVSNFLEPFGVKVDMGIVSGEGSTGSTASEPKTNGDKSSAATVTSEVVEITLAQLRTMGYEDEGGWLRELIRAKEGDVTKVLDALHPVTEED